MRIHCLTFAVRCEVSNRGNQIHSPVFTTILPPFGILLMATQHHRIYKESAYPALSVSPLSYRAPTPLRQVLKRSDPRDF